MTRQLSWTEIDAALTCWARWDMAYGGRLAGDTLKPKELAPILFEGRAWGAAVAAWHQNGDRRLTAVWSAHTALRKSLDADALAMKDAGVPLRPEARLETEERLGAMLDHYAGTADPLPNLTLLEGAFDVSIPSREGIRRSSKYRFSGFIDGWTLIDGRPWIVEFKLRGRLTDPPLLERQRQQRWYAWAFAQLKGPKPAGVIIDERLNEVPKPARLVKGRTPTQMKPSHAKDQLTTPELYIDLCTEYDELPKADVVETLRARQWQQRFPLMFREGELEEAGRELVSAGKLIRDLDSGELSPIRHANKMNCGYCRFREVCSNPEDHLLVDSLFQRGLPKRDRQKEEVPVG